ncbi:MAG: 2-deoxyribose-5-phosphate aldolase [Desulfurococcales archaeon ex4484_217_2]|nr:MAG: 2-deoxyribose-5-phosphate aldolase [Desulfurococcales archaeon ex4484_217_2]
MDFIRKVNVEELAKTIDHTILKPNSTLKDVLRVCRETLEYKFALAMIPPTYVKRAVSEYSDCRVGTVIGFPLGFQTLKTKLKEAEEAISNGASEIDMVMNIMEFKSGNKGYVLKEIEEANYVKSCTGFGPRGVTVHDVTLMFNAVNGEIGVKAAGGIRHAEDAIALLIAGASRLGTSSGVKIIEEYRKLRETFGFKN